MKISIVIPAYNEEKYIGNTLQSIKELKTLKEWDVEVLIINANSTDQTAEIGQKYGAKIINVPHKGIGFARQEGIKYARGAIIAFTDADTRVPGDWLIRHVETLQKSGVVFSYGTYWVIDGAFPYKQYMNYIVPHVLWWTHHLFRSPIAAGQNMAFWKEKALLVGGFDIRLRVMEDLDLAIRMMKVGRVEFIKNLVVYSSGRRSNEGWKFFARMIVVSFKYFFIGRKSLGRFPDFR